MAKLNNLAFSIQCLIKICLYNIQSMYTVYVLQHIMDPQEFLLCSVWQAGVVGGIMQVLLLSMSAHITKQLGMAPGGEFRAAYKEVWCIQCIPLAPQHIILRQLFL